MKNATGAASPPNHPIWTGDPPPATTPSWKLPDVQLGVDSTSRLAAAIDRLAAAIERLSAREDER